MHRIESDNVVISDGKNEFGGGPPATTLNPEWLNSVQEELCNAIEGFGVNLGTKLNDSKDQLFRVITALRTGTTRSATYVFASSDSETDSQNGADAIIQTSADAAVTINAKITELSGLGGGSICLLEGTYNCSTAIMNAAAVSNIIILGSGYRTILKRNAAITGVIDSSACTNCIFSNFLIDGNKVTYNGAIYNGVYGNSSDYSSIYTAIISHSNDDHGFRYCNQINSCYTYSNTLNGFTNSNQISSCYAYSNTGFGFSLCNQISSCYAYSNTGFGFLTCNQISSCYAYSNTASGFGTCNQISSCYAQNNSSSGFSNCNQISSCYSYSNTGFGFSLCNQISSCYSDNNSSSGFSNCEGIGQCKSDNNAASAWPFTSCVGMLGNFGTTGSTWRNCFADYAGTSTIADSPAGGFNKI